ncbi:hypothetical protein [Metamycoplasma equirhinis]|uniref:hypothetical protein n=1 Tax=Metamycoplasma equirhinis TaxID=92402 RepID=UPI0035935F03
MLKIKKAIYTPTLLVAPFILLPLHACSKQTTNAIIWKIPFQKNSFDSRFFSELINKYNNEIAKTKSYMPVNLQFTPDRNNLFTKASLDLITNNKEIPNLFLHYPSLANIAASYDRTLNLREIVQNSDIDKRFLMSDESFGIENQNNVHFLPFGSISDNFIINNWLLGLYLNKLKEFIKKNNLNFKLFKKDKKHKIFDKAINIYNSLSNNEKMELNERWKTRQLEFDVNFLKSNSNFTFSDDLFCSNTGLMSISNYISYSVSNQKRDNSVSVLFVRHSANYAYSLLFHDAHDNMAEYFLKRNKASSFLNYDFDTFDKQKSIKKLYEFLYKHMQNNSLSVLNSKINATETYNFRNKMFMLVSGRIFHTLKDKIIERPTEYSLFSAPTKNLIANSQEKGSFLIQGNNIIAIKKTDLENKSVMNFLNWIYDKNNIKNWKIDGKKVALTPVEYISYVMGYIFPSHNFAENFGKKDEQNLAIKSFLNLLENKKLVGFQEPVDINSNRFRKNIEWAINEYMYNSIKYKEKITFDEFLEKLKKGLTLNYE